jgi:hypothetical protein
MLVSFHEGATFAANATVMYAQPNMGMGVVISVLEPEHLEGQERSKPSVQGGAASFARVSEDVSACRPVWS